MIQREGSKAGNVVLLVGTRKGAFIFSSNDARKDWDMTGPHIPGGNVFHMTYDPRGDGRTLAAVNDGWFGPEIQFTDDLGQTWERPEIQPGFATRDDMTVKNIWHVQPGRDNEPGVLYAGVDPASLFRSDDHGLTWHEVESLANHPTREQWQPGLGGLCLHSVVLDHSNARRMWVGVSAVGVFRTDDGGESWHLKNSGVRADFMPERFPEFGQCPHKVLKHAARADLLYQQNHCGVFRTDDAGDTWQDITEGLPSRFGFVLGLHSKDPDTLYVISEDNVMADGEVGGGYRIVSEAKFRVFRSRNGGADWTPMTKGLPQRNAFLHCMREGMATDPFESCGIYVGTTTGQIFYSRDDGDSWEMMVDNLPPINSVECAVLP
ncbi:MAG: exo-alpha-sialidase [Chloroflexi bacterium]|nr:exo-alpha-sialidase [Chloroflexota bacterium]